MAKNVSSDFRTRQSEGKARQSVCPAKNALGIPLASTWQALGKYLASPSKLFELANTMRRAKEERGMNMRSFLASMAAYYCGHFVERSMSRNFICRISFVLMP